MNPRTVKPELPARVIVTAVFFGVLVFAFVIFAVWQSGVDIKEARMTGTVVEKRFEKAPENQVTINRNGEGMSTLHKEGEYILTVNVPQKDGSVRPITVWLNDKARYDAVKVGDSFDVGPYMVKE